MKWSLLHNRPQLALEQVRQLHKKSFCGVGNRSAETKPAAPEASTQETAAEHSGEPTLDQTARNYAESNPEVAAELIKSLDERKIRGSHGYNRWG